MIGRKILNFEFFVVIMRCDGENSDDMNMTA